MPTGVLQCGTKLSRYGMNQPLATALLPLDFSLAQDTRSINGLLPSGGPRKPIRSVAQLPWPCQLTLWRAGLTALRKPPECICTPRVCALDRSVHLMSFLSIACLRSAIFWTHVLDRLFRLQLLFAACSDGGLARLLFSHTCCAAVADDHQTTAWIGLTRSPLILPASPFDTWRWLLWVLQRLMKGGCRWGGRSNGRQPQHFASGSLPGAACTCGRRVHMLHIVQLPQLWSSVMWRAVTSLIWLMREFPKHTVVSSTTTTTATMMDGPMPRPSCAPPCALTKMVPNLTAPRHLVLTLRMLVGVWTDPRIQPVLCCPPVAGAAHHFMWLQQLARRKTAPFCCVSSLPQVPDFYSASIAHSLQAATWLLPARGPRQACASWSVAITLSRSGACVWCNATSAARPRLAVDVCDNCRVCLCVQRWPRHVAHASSYGSVCLTSLPLPASLPLASWRMNLALGRPARMGQGLRTLLLGGWLSRLMQTSVSGLRPGSSGWYAVSPPTIMPHWPSGWHSVATMMLPCGTMPTAMFLSQRRRRTALNMRPAFARPRSANCSISPVQRRRHRVPAMPLLMRTVAFAQIPELRSSGHSFLDLRRRLVS